MDCILLNLDNIEVVTCLSGILTQNYYFLLLF